MEEFLKSEYDFNNIEEKWYKHWEEKDYFHADENLDKKPFSMVIPPPNVTGSLHMGHALNNTIQDILARYKRMKGYNVLWMPGTDHAGIATQNVVEKHLAKKGISRDDIGREKFIEEVWKWKEQYGNTIIKQLKRLGATCDWKRTRFTMDEGLSKAVREVFVRLYEEGLIYRGKYIINWCPRCHTALSDLEVEMHEHDSYLWYLKYPVKGEKDRYVVVATTRPETMLGDTAVAVNPDDDRYRDLIGKTVILPLMNREIPVIADEYVDKEFGTGVVKITPAHDFNDFLIGEKHNLEFVNVMTKDGKMNENAGEYAGLDRYEAREKIVNDLKEMGLLEKIEDYKLFAGQCYRCSTVVEPLISEQWFVKIKPLAEKAIEAVKNGETRIIPEQWENNYFGWMENIRDWCISRQIWWGHRIPVWYCNNCNKESASRTDLTECPHCGSKDIKQETDVLDTWFSSALWPFSTMGWPEKTKTLEVFYPTSVLVTGFDILFFWVARMMMMGLKFMNDVPFRDVYIHALVRDEHGQKMSKSRGNVIDPLEIIRHHGADALRLTLAAFAAQGRDIKLSEQRIVGYKAFINKVWNAAKFIILNIKDFDYSEPETLSTIDKWILRKLRQCIIEYEKAMNEYKFNEVVHHIYQFTWHEFCDWYIELSKVNLNNDNLKKATQWTLVYVFKAILQMLHPVIPFVTEELWHKFKVENDIIISDFIDYNEIKDYSEEFEEIEKVKELIGGIRNIRGELNIPPSKKIKGFYVTDEDFIEKNLDYIKKLANLESFKTKDYKSKGKFVNDYVAKSEIYLDIEGIVDIEGEKKRLSKEIQKIKKELDRIEKKLQNESFLKKAPSHVVEKEKNKREEFLEKLKKAETSLKIFEKIE